MIKKALISVSDKTGIIEFAKTLEKKEIEIISTGGTAKALLEAKIKVTNVSDLTGFPECLDGRVKTLHPTIHAGILAIRDNKEHMKQLEDLKIDTIDMVVINLYPFKETILKDNVELEEAIENIDIGGPTMLRAAAKNYNDVVVVVNPEDYKKVIDEINETNEVSQKTKFELAYKVFEHTSNYDTLIAKYLREQINPGGFPKTFTMTYEKVQDLRYGENPHQNAAFYKEAGKNKGCLTAAVQHHGKELSYNNINDTNGAIELIKEFEKPTVVAVKHSNPCGVASADTISEAYIKAYEADPVSIFGGIIAANCEIDEKTAEEINKIFVEIVIAPGYSSKALEILKSKKNIRILELPDISEKLPQNTLDMKKVAGGLLVQDYNNDLVDFGKMECVTQVKPSEEQTEDMIFAWKVVKHTKSNAIVFVKNEMTIGIGPGQLNRVMSTKIAAGYAKENAEGAVMASDAYFPFPDCVEVAAAAGIKAIIHPGGSIRDQESLDACNKHGIAMIYTGLRHFKH